MRGMGRDPRTGELRGQRAGAWREVPAVRRSDARLCNARRIAVIRRKAVKFAAAPDP